MNEIFYILFCILLFFSHTNFQSSRSFCLCMSNRTRAACFCNSHIRSIHLPYLFASSFPSAHSISHQNFQVSPGYECISSMSPFSAFSDIADRKYWECLHFRFSSILFVYFLLDSLACPRYYKHLQWE